MITVLSACLFCLVFSGASGLRASRAEFARLQPRVLGGKEIQDRTKAPFNWLVALRLESPDGPVVFCSAVLMNETILLTTAYCAGQLSLLGNELTVTAVVGERDIIMPETFEQSLDIDSFRSHPNFNGSTLDNNIGIIRLVKAATLNSFVQSAVATEEDQTACTDVDESCIFAGWGPYVENSKPTNSRLGRYSSMTLYGDLVTTLWSRFDRGIDAPVGSLYAEAKNPNVRACFFDWGGPVACLRNGKYVLEGLVSEHNCNTPLNLPILVTHVPFFQKWIDSCLRNWARC